MTNLKKGRSKRSVYVTTEGLAEAKSELEYLKKTKRVQVAERIQTAREFGDLAENSEYDAAMDEAAMIENRISELEDILTNVKVIVESKQSDFIVIGSTVKIEMDNEDDEFT